MTLQTLLFWDQVGHLGAAGLMLPLLLIVCACLWQTGQRAVAGRWLLLLAAGAALVLMTKLVFMVWGMGSVALDFTGISGHTTLATAILPVWLAWLPGRWGGRRVQWVALLIGLGIGALVGWSRIAVGAHSVSESVAGWLLGAAIATAAFHWFDQRVSPPLLARGAGLMLLLALSPIAANWLPTEQWERRIAQALSPTGVVHHRSWLRAQAGGRRVVRK
ncbi:phosphatase PAP2 family protein [uncultured Thiodictyon sp.]|uniref:phosphatase PAP2 family protein n=1 Tax=uncultured Thiodictyon sp. TaxID=1846217 RepID=UPI0025F9369D|nr:phosphatase PAP2 family protein [uncultured Thiodictyon sp.]